MATLNLAMGYGPFTFPDKPEFGKYGGKEVAIYFNFMHGEPQIREGSREGSELEGTARNFVLEQLSPQRRIDGEDL